MLRDAAALAHAGSAGVIPPSPDAALIAAANRFLELERQIRATQDAIPDEEDVGEEAAFAAENAVMVANEPRDAEQRVILERMRALRATTLDGHRMRARLLFIRSPEIKEDGLAGEWQGLVLEWLLVRDLVGGRRSDGDPSLWHRQANHRDRYRLESRHQDRAGTELIGSCPSSAPWSRHFRIRSLMRLARASIAKGLVRTCMPGSRWPWLSTAFSA